MSVKEKLVFVTISQGKSQGIIWEKSGTFDSCTGYEPCYCVQASTLNVFIFCAVMGLSVAVLEQRTLIWSRAVSSPANISGVANWINSGKLGVDRPRSSSVPLVLYKRKFTLQFDRQQSALTESAIDRQEEGKAPSLYFTQFMQERRETKLHQTRMIRFCIYTRDIAVKDLLVTFMQVWSVPAGV